MKRIVMRALLALLSVGLPCFSQDSHENAKEWNLALSCIGYGNRAALESQHVSALENYQRADKLFDQMGYRSEGADFLIFFGKAVSCDNLGMRDQAEQALGSLFLMIHTDEQEETSCCSPHESENALALMYSLASQAPSVDIRSSLLCLINEIAERCEPQFRFAEPLAMGSDGWYFAYPEACTSAVPCRAWWKKVMKVWDDLIDIYNKIEEIFGG